MKLESKAKTTLKVILLTLLMALSVILCTSVRKNVLKADTQQIAIPRINIGYDIYLYPTTNDMDGWFDTYSVYTTTNYAYIYISSGLIRSDTTINSVILTLAFEWTSENNIWYTNNQENDCIAEFTTLSNPTFNNSLDVMLFKYYIPHYENLGYGEDYWCSFYTDLDYSYDDILVLRIKRSFYNALDSDWYPRILPTTISTQFDGSSYFQAGIDTGKTEGYNIGYSAGMNEGYARGYSAGADIGSEDYHIHDLLFTIFDTPFEVLHNLFSFTIFSTPVWTIIVSLLSLLVVLWLIKRLLT